MVDAGRRRTVHSANTIIYAKALCNLANNNFGGQKLGLQQTVDASEARMDASCSKVERTVHSCKEFMGTCLSFTASNYLTPNLNII